jgi:hypothetical protein
MQYINGLIGCVFVVIGLIHVPHPMPLTWVPYLGAAVLAFITLKPEISVAFARILAITTTVAMFFFFAGFFVVAPKLAADWYMRPEGWDAVGRITTGFLMLPILSEYSCRLKAECREALEHQRRPFFSAPRSVANHTPPR